MEDPRSAKAKAIIGQHFTRLREEAGISQNKLADMARKAELTGANRSYIIDIEKGRANPTIETFANLLSLCGYDLEEFLTGLKSSNVPPGHHNFHRMLSVILNSGNDDLIHGLRVSLEALSEKAARLMKARASPTNSPSSGLKQEAQRAAPTTE